MKKTITQLCCTAFVLGTLAVSGCGQSVEGVSAGELSPEQLAQQKAASEAKLAAYAEEYGR